MSGIAELKESIKKQFIPLYDSVLFIAEHGKGTPKDGINLLKTRLLDKQVNLLLVDDFYLTEIKLFQTDYEAVEYEGQYITVTFIISELEKSIANNKATSNIQNYGFGAKRFYETLSNDILKIDIPIHFLQNALSPDCYHDDENPLTQVVQELQKENALLRQQQSHPPKLNNLTENYISLDEAIAYLTKSLDFSIINPISFLERSIKQCLIIPYFEFYGYIHFETSTDKFSTVIQIDEVHGYFKDYNHLKPNNAFTNLSKNEYQVVGGKVEKIIFADCLKFHGILRNGSEWYEPNEAIEPPHDITVTFFSLQPKLDRELLLVNGNSNREPSVSKNAIHFKVSELETLINQNSHLKISGEGQQPTDQTAHLQATIDRLTAENKQQADTIQQLNEQLASQPEPINEISGKSQEAISRLVYVLLDLVKFEVTAHSGNDNLAIETHSQKLLNKPLTKPFIAEWLKNAMTAKEKHAK